MASGWWIILILIILWRIGIRRRKMAAVWQIRNKRKQNREMLAMKELAKQLIGEECIIYMITSNEGCIQGVIKEINNGCMLIERGAGGREIINLDFVTRIREYPRKKNGRKKGIVLD